MRRFHLSFSLTAIFLLLCSISAQSYSQTVPSKEDLNQATPHTTKTTTKDTQLSGKDDGDGIQQVSPMPSNCQEEVVETPVVAQVEVHQNYP